MKKIFTLLLALVLCVLGPMGAISQNMSRVYGSEIDSAKDSEESETQTETELQPVLLDSDKVSTTDFLLYSSACVVMDTQTGAILYYKNKLNKHYPASTTKILTTLLALEHTNPGDNITFSENAINSITWDSSNMALTAGNSLTIEQTLYGIMLQSANEASNGMAEYVSGSMEQFSKDMTNYAINLGCRRTNFTNPSGLHDDNHYTTAKDLAIIASAASKNEVFRGIAGSATYTIENINYKIKQPETDKDSTPGETAETSEPEAEPVTLYNHHKMVNNVYPYEDCYSGKTGYTGEARNTLVTFAKRGDMDLVCVILDCPGGKNYIYMDTEQALNYSFDHYDRLTDEYNQTQKDQNYIPISTIDWYHTQTPLSKEEMYYPFLKQAYEIYAKYAQDRKIKATLDDAIRHKSVKQFIQYSKMENYKPLIIAGAILLVITIILVFLLFRLIKVLKRKRSLHRYKRMREKRLLESPESNPKKNK